MTKPYPLNSSSSFRASASETRLNGSATTHLSTEGKSKNVIDLRGAL